MKPQEIKTNTIIRAKGIDISIGNEIHQLNPDNGYFSGKTYVYSSMLDKMYEPYAVSPVLNSPCCLFEIR